MQNDLRREQVKLLRYEKALQETIMGKVALMAGLTSIAAALAPLRRVALSVEAKLSDSKVAEVFAAPRRASARRRSQPSLRESRGRCRSWCAFAAGRRGPGRARDRRSARVSGGRRRGVAANSPLASGRPSPSGLATAARWRSRVSRAPDSPV